MHDTDKRGGVFGSGRRIFSEDATCQEAWRR